MLLACKVGPVLAAGANAWLAHLACSMHLLAEVNKAAHDEALIDGFDIHITLS